MVRILPFALLLTAAPAAAGVHPPEVEARLAPIVGDWTIEGHEASYRENCVWYADRAFVVCDTTDSSDNTASVSVIGYSKADGHFTYHNYSGSGSSRSEIAFPLGPKGLVFTAERRSAAGVARVSSELVPLPDGRTRFRQQRSVNGGPWTETVVLHYVLRSAVKATAKK